MGNPKSPVFTFPADAMIWCGHCPKDQIIRKAHSDKDRQEVYFNINTPKGEGFVLVTGSEGQVIGVLPAHLNPRSGQVICLDPACGVVSEEAPSRGNLFDASDLFNEAEVA